MMKEKISVLIADDNQDFSHTLANYIEGQDDMEVIGIAKDGAEAIAKRFIYVLRTSSNFNNRCFISRRQHSLITLRSSLYIESFSIVFL